MNASINMYEDNDDSDYKVQYREIKTERPAAKASNRPTFGRSRAKTPTQFNGIHRRRNKRAAW